MQDKLERQRQRPRRAAQPLGVMVRLLTPQPCHLSKATCFFISKFMRFGGAVISLFLLASVADAAQSGEAVQALSRRVHAYFVDMGRGDIAGIERTPSADYIVIGGDGKLETRAERLAWLRSNAKDLADIAPSELLVRVYGNMGIVTGLVEISPDGSAPPIRERFTQVWVTEGDGWKMVTGQITLVKK